MHRPQVVVPIWRVYEKFRDEFRRLAALSLGSREPRAHHASYVTRESRDRGGCAREAIPLPSRVDI